jgi:hypothetical protein
MLADGRALEYVERALLMGKAEGEVQVHDGDDPR